MALTTYTSTNNNGDPIIASSAIDTGVGSAPGARPSTFTPTGGYPALTATTDPGLGSTPTKRSQIFEPISYTAAIDPGLTVNG